MANRQVNGFVYHRGGDHTSPPVIHERDVVSNYGSNLYTGFAVRYVDANGTVEITPGTEGTPGLIYGIVDAIRPYWDAARGRMVAPEMASPKYLPASVVYGSVVDRTSKVSVISAKGALFRAQADAALATPTRAGALALRGTTGDHIISGSDMALDISDFESSDAAPGSHQWTIIDVVEEPNTDWTASRLTFIVAVNEGMFQEAGSGL